MTQQITPLPAPPQPSDSPVDFDQKAFALLGGLPQFVNEANTLGGQITALGENSTESAAAALASKNAAATSASNSAGSATASGQSASNSASSANAANQSRIEAQNAAEAAAASAESVDTAYLRNRANHTGTQAIDTVEGLAQAITDAKARANHTGPLNWAWATYGGTANTVTLAPAFARTAYVAGEEFRFRATAANTGATTINVGGLGAKAAVTVTGAALPAGYIRTGVDTVCVYDGLRFVVQRDMERGSNANGTYVKYADGTLECYGKVLMPAQAISTEVSVVWTHPSSFSGIPTPAFLPLAEQGAGSQSAVGILNRNGIWLQGQTAGTTTITAYAYLDARNFPVLLSVSSKGTWY